MILTRNDSTLLADTYYFVVIYHHNVLLSWCDCLVRFSFVCCFCLLFVCWYLSCLSVCFAVCMSYLSVCVHNLVLYFAVCIWAYGQNTINHLKSEVSLSLSLSLSLSPWYNRTGWLGVKHQLTYLLTLSLSLYKRPLPGWQWVLKRLSLRCLNLREY